MVFDCLIVGAGPAGLSAASWLHQYGYQVAVCEQEATLLHNLRRLHFAQDWLLGLGGQSLEACAQVLAADFQRIAAVVPVFHEKACQLIAPALHQTERVWTLLTDRAQHRAKTVLVATGRQARRPWHVGVEVPPEDRRAVWDAYELTQQRSGLSEGGRPKRMLLLGAGDNAIENAVHLLQQGHDITIWSRGPLRARRQWVQRLQSEAQQGQLQWCLNRPLPTRMQRDERGVWLVSAGDDAKVEVFDQVVGLLGFESMTLLQALLPHTLLHGTDAMGSASGSFPDAQMTDRLRAQGVFLCGDAQDLWHPCVQTALADGVQVAHAVHHRLATQEAFKEAGDGHTGTALEPATPGLAPTSPSQAAPRSLMLSGLRFHATLGVLPHEKTAPQPIQVDVELNLGPQDLQPHDDDILHVLDYRKVRQIIIDECSAEHVNLLESLIGKLALRLMRLPQVQGVRIKITKLKIFDDCEVAIRTQVGAW